MDHQFLEVLLFDDKKIKMENKQKENQVGCTGEGKREGKTGTVLELSLKVSWPSQKDQYVQNFPIEKI